MSGQPSLIFVGQQPDGAVDEAAHPAGDRATDESAGRRLWEDGDGAESTAQDGASDEGFAADEADFACSSTSGLETAPAPKNEADPDVHWNLHAPEFEFRSEQAAEAPLQERKLSATELLIRSSNDAQLAVLLAAANDDPDEMEPHEEELDFEPVSPRSLDDTQNAGQEANGTP